MLDISEGAESARAPRGHVSGIIGDELTISAIALLSSSRLLIAGTVAILLLLRLLLLGVGVLLGTIRVVLAVAA